MRWWEGGGKDGVWVGQIPMTSTSGISRRLPWHQTSTDPRHELNDACDFGQTVTPKRRKL